LWADGCGVLSDESFEDYSTGDLFVLTAGDAPPDTQRLE
jgi:hypothetical protein